MRTSYAQGKGRLQPRQRRENAAESRQEGVGGPPGVVDRDPRTPARLARMSKARLTLRGSIGCPFLVVSART